MSFLTSTTNPTTAMKFYANVMDDVLAGVREAFLDEGVDEQVLQELRHMWEAKVQASKAVDPPEIVEPQAPPLQITQSAQSDTKPQIQTKQTNGVSTTPTQSSRAKSAAVVTTAPAPMNLPAPIATSNTLSIQQPIPQPQPQPQVQPPPPQPQPQLPSTPALPTPIVNNVAQDKIVPIQLTLPAPAGSQDSQSRVYNIQVPSSALATDQLQRILTAQVISATMALPVNVASTLLQQHVTASLQASNAQANSSTNTSNTVQVNGVQGMLSTENSNNRQFPHANQMPGNITQVDGTYNSSDDETDNVDRLTASATVSRKKMVKFPIEISGDSVLQLNGVCDNTAAEATSSKKKGNRGNKILMQLDGVYDTSDDDEDDDDDDDLDDDDDDDDDENDDKDEEDNDEAENGVEEDPLNSGDDVSEGDNADLFETENVVVCQYDKINRSRNKWKFYLKDGIMNLAGRDYIFQKANGDAEW